MNQSTHDLKDEFASHLLFEFNRGKFSSQRESWNLKRLNVYHYNSFVFRFICKVPKSVDHLGFTDNVGDKESVANAGIKMIVRILRDMILCLAEQYNLRVLKPCFAVYTVLCITSSWYCSSINRVIPLRPLLRLYLKQCTSNFENLDFNHSTPFRTSDK